MCNRKTLASSSCPMTARLGQCPRACCGYAAAETPINHWLPPPFRCAKSGDPSASDCARLRFAASGLPSLRSGSLRFRPPLRSHVRPSLTPYFWIAPLPKIGDPWPPGLPQSYPFFSPASKKWGPRTVPKNWPGYDPSFPLLGKRGPLPVPLKPKISSSATPNPLPSGRGHFPLCQTPTALTTPPWGEGVSVS